MKLRPYLIAPKFIEQPTWGGTYIVSYKGWDSRSNLSSKKVGQSYELSGTSVFATTLTDSTDPSFTEENEREFEVRAFPSLSEEEAVLMYGPTVYEKYKKMPLLIKFTQAKGNSFQLHRKPEVSDPYWIPKAESWYFFEDGYITFGLKKGTSVEAYRRCCEEINAGMVAISKRILAKEISVEQGSQEAQIMIHEKNPWQFVNVLHVPKQTILDLSGGGLHHSWEENKESLTGNIVYEVQQDSPDETSTLRSFDQGKIKSDGTIRELTIEKYFEFLDTDENKNSVENAKQFPHDTRILTTKNYYMDEFIVSRETSVSVSDSFAHLFVKDGDVVVTTAEGNVRLTKGHSCLVPHAANSFLLRPNLQNSVVIRTGIEKTS